jgi:hypothetical protein
MVADGFVKPWIAHFYHFVGALGWVLLTAIVLVVTAILIVHSITGEWDMPERK